MKSLVILFAIFAIVAAFPEQEQERERRGILGGAALAGPWIGAPSIAAAPIGVAAVGPKLLAAPAVVAAPALASPWGLKAW
ncbi:apidermin 2 [Lasioglossum baleicum]|uniref:apidermin 2 n=1 Tax=Lasioglossum baleicum TaxID=434251 RepID=UPI003FCE5758